MRRKKWIVLVGSDSADGLCVHYYSRSDAARRGALRAIATGSRVAYGITDDGSEYGLHWGLDDRGVEMPLPRLATAISVIEGCLDSWMF